MNHWPFIYLSYAVFTIAILIDALLPIAARRRALRLAEKQMQREAKRRST